MKAAAVAIVLVVCLATSTFAQFGRQFRGFGPRGYPARFAQPETFGRGFNFCRAVYTSGRREAGGQGWSTDYPDAELNFSIRLSELTKTRVTRDAQGAPDHVVVRLTEEALYQCPYLHMEDVGTAAFTDAEVAGLRTYLLKGGFVWADDYWGTYAWHNWVSQLARVLPPSEYPIEEITLDHPIFRTMFEVKTLPQIPSIQFWRTSGGGTSERGGDSATPAIRGVSDRHGNLMVLMTHNTDISDAWEREGEDPRFFYRFSPDGYAVGINVILYALTH
ncbi:MAG: hypothetical protein A3I61_14735 [Acidobacteria bacterium RIFCSPLOWO2_02_FULL_68_18]|nr:MAG: hypothetical protein A3I61_14735 [Acidobacteria bacterium RIFCSPLOWO2_02_FULL_68_18]OFW50918.1 MAG: hypothetical protein A3G77_14915 [Acidobacteria bacterium RIFCSPLOWO2_12_FULL_68_19]